MKKVVLAYSGGLDTSYCVKYLSEEMGLEVYTALANTGAGRDRGKGVCLGGEETRDTGCHGGILREMY